MDLFKTSTSHVLFPLTGMIVTAYTGLFDGVELEIGHEHYAEHTWVPFLPVMPLNTLINFIYIALGMYWCGMTQTATRQGVLKDKDSELFYTFNIMTTLYGFVQLFRIVTQRVIWAVLDQWCTLPFFALLLVWGLYYKYGWSSKRAAMIMSISVVSYAMSLFSKIGFEVSLGLHIIAAIYGGITAYRKHPAEDCLSSFYLALLSCSGFVALKLLDHKLTTVSFIFKYISGHFLSKICDIYQIHFVNNFFLDLTLQKAADISVQNQAQFFKECEKNGYYEQTLSNDILYEVPLRRKDE